jgi:hypothetical protein
MNLLYIVILYIMTDSLEWITTYFSDIVLDCTILYLYIYSK